MKKNTIKAFTLVEMLIVIVIIGILIASLMPRMQSAQWRARDVARKNDLAQIQTAVITSQQDRGAFPWMAWNSWEAINYTGSNASITSWDGGMIVDNIWMNLWRAWMSSIPTDPNGSNVNFGLWTNFNSGKRGNANWKYIYLVAKRNWVSNAWFALMAKTEVEWWSNWIVCDSGSDISGLSNWYITSGDDLASIKLCKTVTQWTSCSSNTENCTYTQTSQLRYLLLY